jgi:hypothetical protein
MQFSNAKNCTFYEKILLLTCCLCLFRFIFLTISTISCAKLFVFPKKWKIYISILCISNNLAFNFSFVIVLSCFLLLVLLKICETMIKMNSEAIIQQTIFSLDYIIKALAKASLLINEGSKKSILQSIFFKH